MINDKEKGIERATEITIEEHFETPKEEIITGNEEIIVEEVLQYELPSIVIEEDGSEEVLETEIIQ